MSRRSKILVSRTLYQLGLMTVVTSVFWTGMGVYRALSEAPELKVEKKVLEPLKPTIDQATIETLTQRRRMEEVTLNELLRMIDIKEAQERAAQAELEPLTLPELSLLSESEPATEAAVAQP